MGFREGGSGEGWDGEKEGGRENFRLGFREENGRDETENRGRERSFDLGFEQEMGEMGQRTEGEREKFRSGFRAGNGRDATENIGRERKKLRRRGRGLSKKEKELVI